MSSNVTRRSFIGTGIAALAAANLAQAEKKKSASTAPPAPVAPTGPFSLMKLPYAESALAPGISANTVGFHYGKHHHGYVNKTNTLLKGTDLANKSLEDIIKATYNRADKTALYDNAAQLWNHNFYWQSMKPRGGGSAPGELGKKIAADFGSFEAFAKELQTAATGQFGSGWAWLVEDAGKLRVIKTSNADNPIALGKKPIITIDVWEHAYYLDYKNLRVDYVKAYLDSLVNWDFAAANLAKA
ncbi:MAG: superoxide dismutase [Polyangia bacterium]